MVVLLLFCKQIWDLEFFVFILYVYYCFKLFYFNIYSFIYIHNKFLIIHCFSQKLLGILININNFLKNI